MEEQEKDQEVEVVKYKLELSYEEIEVVFRGLLELPGKYSLAVINSIDKQLKSQIKEDVPA